MADTWGSTTLTVYNYERPTAGGLTERPLVRDPSTSTSTPQSTLMGGGRIRYRRTLQLHLSKTNLDAMEADLENCTARTLTLTDTDGGWSDSMYIADIRGVLPLGHADYLATVEFVEA